MTTVAPIVADFRDGLAAGELRIQYCDACGAPNMWPRYACPSCQSTTLSFKASSGRGTLQSYTVLRIGAPEGFEADLPYALGVVRLAEGVQLLARLSPDGDGDWHEYRCDDQVVFVPTPGTIAERPCATFKRADR